MSGWVEFKNDAGKIASKAAVKAGEFTDAATAVIKLQGMKLRLCEEYEKLGRLTYKTHKSAVDRSDSVAEVIAEIDKLRSAIKKIEDDIKERKEARAAGTPDAESTAEKAGAEQV